MARRSILRRTWEALSAGFSAAVTAANSSFEEEYVSADPLDERSWERWENRVQRYRFLWANYENTPYSKRHNWSLQMRQAWDLYAHVRSVFSPAHALGEFYAQHLMGGRLDPEAGDGKSVPSALPIVIPKDSGDPESLRRAISAVWRDSNWQVNKTVWTRNGAVMGDTALQVVEDEARRKVYFSVVRPTSLKWVDVDPFGNVKGYVIEEQRGDPEWDGTGQQPLVTFTEVCRKAGETIEFETYRSGEPYDWRSYPDGRRGDTSSWSRPYGFVPLVLTQHINVGLCWGWSEFHALLSRIRELDDLGSCITDQARRKLNNPIAFNTRRPNDAADNKARTADSEYAAREQSSVPLRGTQAIKWIDKDNLRGIPMAGDLSISDVDGHARVLLESIYHEYPELKVDTSDLSGDTSGRSRRILRQAAEAKVNSRRAGYDDSLVRAHAMAVSVGSMGGDGGTPYPGFEGFTADSYSSGALVHQIGKRSVFAVDPLDDAELLLAEGNAAVAWATAELPLEILMRWLGKSPEDIAEATRLIEAERKRKEEQAMAVTLSKLASRTAGMNTGGNPPPPRPMTALPPTAERAFNDGNRNGN
jgi:hypothetical protein